MNQDEWAQILTAYRHGLDTDIIQMQQGTEEAWGVIWTIPPHSQLALERAVKQAQRCQAKRLRYVTVACLVPSYQDKFEVVIVSEGPPLSQEARTLADGRLVKVEQNLTNQSLISFLQNSGPSKESPRSG